MNRLSVSEEVYTVTSEHGLISNDHVSIVLREQCLWTVLMDNSRPVGIAFMGPSSFVVDAIAETRIGAVGRSVSGTFNGVQLYFGAEPALRTVSRPATDIDASAVGLEGIAAFKTLVDNTLREHQHGTGIELDPVHEERQILIGKDAHSTDVLLVVRRNEMLFKHGEDMFIVKDGNIVTVGRGRVTLGRRYGAAFTIDQHGYGRDLGLGICMRLHRPMSRMFFDCHDPLREQSEFRSWDDWDMW